MTWRFERNGERLQCAIGRDDANGCYRMVVKRTDAPDTIEEIWQATALVERSIEVMSALRHDGWRPLSREPDAERLEP